jgi:hypothetical protein
MVNCKKTDLFGWKAIKSVTFTAILVAGAYVYATASRKVTIPAEIAVTNSSTANAGIRLINPSSAAVNYNLSCYNKSGTLTYEKPSLTLLAKNQITHGAGPVCGDGANPTYSSTANSMIQCGWVAWAQRSANCPTGYHLCSVTEVNANRGGAWLYGWASGLPNYTSGWWVTYDGGVSTYNPADNYPTYSPYSQYGCNASNSSAGTTWNCGVSSGYANSFCCPDAGTTIEVPSSYCTVEINSTTPTEGYLVSPQFKGSAPF